MRFDNVHTSPRSTFRCRVKQAIRNIMYFPRHQHLAPIAVEAAWLIGALITLMLAARRGRSPAAVWPTA